MVTDEELIKTPGEYPCTVRVGLSAYDFTPFKIAASSVNSGYGIAWNSGNTTQWYYGWCQQLSTLQGAPCNGTVFAQSNELTTCVSYSAGGYGDFNGESIAT